MDAEKAFTFPFEDKEWISKLGLGALISLVPILNFAWYGYMVDILRNVMNQDPLPLPAWDELGKKLSEGLILFGATLVYASPVLIALCLPLSITASSGLFSGNSNMEEISRRITETGSALFFCLLCIGLAYGFVLSILYSAILILFSREGTFASCFRLRDAFQLISQNAGSFFTTWALSIAASFGVALLIGFVNLVVGWIPCIGWVVGMVLAMGAGAYSNVVYAHLFGQFGKTAFAEKSFLPVT